MESVLTCATMALPIAFAATMSFAQEGSVETGQSLYARTCATCHGLEAQGNGPMAEILAVSPPDITQLGAGDPFLMADIVRRIDGRDMLLAHGGPMPLFGHIFEDRSAVIEDPDGTPIFTSQAILDIAAYLASVQR